MPWIIKVWIPVEPENPQTYRTKEAAEEEIENLELMQPQNIYEAVEVEDDDKQR